MKATSISILLIFALGLFSCEKEDPIDKEIEEEIKNKMVIGTTAYEITDVAKSERNWEDVDENGNPIQAKQLTLVFSTEAIVGSSEDELWNYFDANNGTKILLSITGDGFKAGKFNKSNTLDFEGSYKIGSATDVEFEGETGELLVEQLDEGYSIIYTNSAEGIHLSYVGNL